MSATSCNRFDCPLPYGGSIRVTWATCPNKKCVSRDFEHWDVEYNEMDFWCGTCETLLMKPIFCLPVNGKHKGFQGRKNE